ncbi:hypothetical protein P3W45_000660 [Vairimorpha bombi]|jgi:hypothetical protein
MGPGNNKRTVFIVGGILLIIVLYFVFTEEEEKCGSNNFGNNSPSSISQGSSYFRNDANNNRYEHKDNDFTRKDDYSYRKRQSTYSDQNSAESDQNSTYSDQNSAESDQNSTYSDQNSTYSDQDILYDDQDNTDLSQHDINYLKYNEEFDEAVNEVLSEQGESKRLNILKALIYCEKAVTCMSRDLIKTITVFFRTKYKDENEIELIYLTDKELDNVYNFFDIERIRFESGNKHIIKLTLRGTLNYVREVYHSMLHGYQMPTPKGDPRSVVVNNQKLFEKMKHSISVAFPKDVVDTIYTKCIKIIDVDYTFSLLELHFYFNILIALGKN